MEQHRHRAVRRRDLAALPAPAHEALAGVPRRVALTSDARGGFPHSKLWLHSPEPAQESERRMGGTASAASTDEASYSRIPRRFGKGSRRPRSCSTSLAEVLCLAARAEDAAVHFGPALQQVVPSLPTLAAQITQTALDLGEQSYRCGFLPAFNASTTYTHLGNTSVLVLRILKASYEARVS